MRLTCGMVVCLLGCSAQDGTSGDHADAPSDAATETLACDSLEGHRGPCPAAFGDVSCTASTVGPMPLACATLDGYDVAFEIDTWTRCFYDRGSHALVGVERESPVRVQPFCYGVVEESCAASGPSVCSGDASPDGG